MGINIALVKELREKTGCGIKDCKQVLAACDSDMEKAIEELRKKGLATAAKKADRGAKAGRIVSYIHAGGQIGVLLELNCESDFVANTEKFQELGKDICMQICAMDPIAVSRDDVPKDMIEKEKAVYLDQVKGKPVQIQEKIINGKLEKFYKENVLLEQNYVKNEDMTIDGLVKESIGTIKENIVIAKFQRFQIGG